MLQQLPEHVASVDGHHDVVAVDIWHVTMNDDETTPPRTPPRKLDVGSTFPLTHVLPDSTVRLVCALAQRLTNHQPVVVLERQERDGEHDHREDGDARDEVGVGCVADHHQGHDHPMEGVGGEEEVPAGARHLDAAHDHVPFAVGVGVCLGRVVGVGVWVTRKGSRSSTRRFYRLFNQDSLGRVKVRRVAVGRGVGDELFVGDGGTGFVVKDRMHTQMFIMNNLTQRARVMYAP